MPSFLFALMYASNWLLDVSACVCIWKVEVGLYAAEDPKLGHGLLSASLAPVAVPCATSASARRVHLCRISVSLS